MNRSIMKLFLQFQNVIYILSSSNWPRWTHLTYVTRLTYIYFFKLVIRDAFEKKTSWLHGDSLNVHFVYLKHTSKELSMTN